MTTATDLQTPTPLAAGLLEKIATTVRYETGVALALYAENGVELWHTTHQGARTPCPLASEELQQLINHARLDGNVVSDLEMRVWALPFDGACMLLGWSTEPESELLCREAEGITSVLRLVRQWYVAAAGDHETIEALSEELSQRYEEISFLCDTVEGLDLSRTLSEGMLVILEQARQGLELDRLEAFVFDDSPAAQLGLPRLSELSRVLTLGAGSADALHALVTEACRAGTWRVYNRLSERAGPEALRDVFEHLILLPVMVGEGVAGVVVGGRRRGVRQFNAGDVKLLNLITNQLGIMIKNRTLLSEVEKTSGALEQSLHELEHEHQRTEMAYLETIMRLSLAAEYRDHDTANHLKRISKYSELIAERLGLPEERVRMLRYASPMHDIGKMGIPDNILLKPGKLTPEEFEIIKTHTTIGSSILSDSQSELLEMSRMIALCHHEKFDGSGYPNSLSGDAIPIEGQIVGLVDVVDALLAKRCYKESWSFDKVVEYIKEQAGKQFSPRLVQIFLDNLDAVRQVAEQYAYERAQ